MYRRYNHRRKPSGSRARKLVVASTLTAACLPFLLLGISGSSFATQPLSPQTTELSGRVFSEGVKIELDRTSPAYAALEDSWLEDFAGEMEAIPANMSARSLAAGGAYTAVDLAERIIRENRRETALANQERNAREMRARAMAEATTEALRKLADSIAASGAQAKQIAEQVEPVVQAAAQAIETVDHPTQTISLTDLRMSREELIGSLILPIAQAPGGDEKPQPPKTIASVRPPTQRPPRPADPSGYEDVHDPARTLAQESRGLVNKDSVEANAPHQVVIAGPLEFSGGLAMANSQDRLTVYREYDGEALETGFVWIRDGRYEIFVEQAVGHLIAELRTPYGDILGRGAVDLSNISQPRRDQQRVSPVALRIKPVTQGVAGVVSRKEANKSVPLKSAQVVFKDLPLETATDANGRFEQTALLEGSSVIVKAARPGYWGTLAFARAGSETNIDLLPDQAGQTIQRLVASAKAGHVSIMTDGIVYGRVARAGQPVAGAKVDLMTTSESMRPIYFNSAGLPDPNLTMTSSNGLYAFYPVPAGAHAVQVAFEDRVTEPIIFPTEERTVSRIDVETAIEKKAKVKVFDAFRTDWALNAELSHPGKRQAIARVERGESVLRYADGQGLLIIDAEAGRPYERVRLTLDRDRRSIYFPMIQSKWLEGIRSSLRLNREPNSGVVVGFVQGAAAYRVAMEDKSVSNQSRLLYFNSKGDITGLDYGEPGGGFILLNVPQGFRTVTVQPSGTPRVYAAYILVEPGVTNVLNHWVR